MVPVETERVRLRRLEGRDAQCLAGYRSDPSVATYQSWIDMTLHEAHDFIKEQAAVRLGDLGKWYQLAIADKSTDILIGDIGVCVKSPGNIAEIGFTVAPEAQGRGLATEACRAAIELVFRESDVTTLEAVIDSRNTSAIALARRLGMVFMDSEVVEFKGELCSEYRFVLSCQRGRAG